MRNHPAVNRLGSCAVACVFLAVLLLAALSCQEQPAQDGKPGQEEGPKDEPEDTGTPSIAVEPAATKEERVMAFQLTSTAFTKGAPIPKKYTGEGADVSPPLDWTEPPEGTKSFALVNDDPDAPMGTWVHWVVYDIPGGVRELPEAVPKTETLESGVKQGMTDFKRSGYGGPMPPPGKPHRYFFKLYALDTVLDLPSRATKAQVEAAMKGHVLGEAQLMGTYQR